jgi:hypothetical protein
MCLAINFVIFNNLNHDAYTFLPPSRTIIKTWIGVLPTVLGISIGAIRRLWGLVITGIMNRKLVEGSRVSEFEQKL